jgi:hypothetical protein
MEVDEIRICEICFLKFDDLKLFEEHTLQGQCVEFNFFDLDVNSDNPIKDETDPIENCLDVKKEVQEEFLKTKMTKDDPGTQNLGSSEPALELRVDPTKIHKTFSRSRRKPIPATQTINNCDVNMIEPILPKPIKVKTEWLEQQLEKLHKCLVCKAKCEYFTVCLK